MGQRKGYKQTPEHIANRVRLGEDHHHWKGDAIVERSGRSRALRMYPPEPCASCGAAKAERHHIDGNTSNNAPENVRFVCRKCHMAEDGRLERFIELAKANQAKAVAARDAKRTKPTHCPRGHLYVHFNAKGCGNCRICLNEYKRNKRRMDKQANSGPVG